MLLLWWRARPVSHFDPSELRDPRALVDGTQPLLQAGGVPMQSSGQFDTVLTVRSYADPTGQLVPVAPTHLRSG